MTCKNLAPPRIILKTNGISKPQTTPNLKRSKSFGPRTPSKNPGSGFEITSQVSRDLTLKPPGANGRQFFFATGSMGS